MLCTVAPLGPHFLHIFFCPLADKPAHIWTEIASQEKMDIFVEWNKMPVMINENQLPRDDSY